MNNNMLKTLVDFFQEALKDLPSIIRALLAFAFVGLFFFAVIFNSLPTEQRLLGFLIIFLLMVLVFAFMFQYTKASLAEKERNKQYVAVRVKRAGHNKFMENVHVSLFQNGKLLDETKTSTDGEAFFFLSDKADKSALFTIKLQLQNYKDAEYHLSTNSPDNPQTVFISYRNDKTIDIPEPVAPEPSPALRRLAISVTSIIILGAVITGVMWTTRDTSRVNPIPTTTPIPTITPIPQSVEEEDPNNESSSQIVFVIIGVIFLVIVIVIVAIYYRTRPY